MQHHRAVLENLLMYRLRLTLLNEEVIRALIHMAGDNLSCIVAVPGLLLYAAAGPEFMQTFGDALADVALLFEELVLRVVPAKVGGPPSAQTVAVAAIGAAWYWLHDKIETALGK